MSLVYVATKKHGMSFPMMGLVRQRFSKSVKSGLEFRYVRGAS